MQRKRASGSGRAVEQMLSKFTHSFLKSTGKSVDSLLFTRFIYAHVV